MMQCPDQGALDSLEPQLQLAPALLFPRPTPSPSGPSWGLGWANATAPEGLQLMARKWPDNSSGDCWARVPAKGREDIPNGFMHWLSWAFCLEPFSNFSKFPHWAQAWKVEEHALCRLLSVSQIFCSGVKAAAHRDGDLWTVAQ